MAGVGSGWFDRRSTKLRTDEYPAIDVRRVSLESSLVDEILLAGGVLARVEWKSCHFGGYRPYFRCPRCSGRCCLLYRFRIQENGAALYGCQKCLGMVHPVENEGRLERAVRRNNKVLNRQGYDATRPEGKPLWMRWPTWWRLSNEVAATVLARLEYHEKIVMLLKHLDEK